MKTVTVFGSGRIARGSKNYLVAYNVGKALGTAGYAVCNGGYGGTMEASAKGASEAGGHTIGIVTSKSGSARANQWIEETIDTGTHINRLQELVRRGDAYVFLNGGTGTLLEFAYVLEAANKKIVSAKPIVLVDDYWQPVIDLLKNEPGAPEAKKTYLNNITVARKPEDVPTLLGEN